MITVSDPVTEEVRTAWGRYSKVTRQELRVQPEDINTRKHHYLGYNYATYQFKPLDEGRHIIVYWDGKGWTCWVFRSEK